LPAGTSASRAPAKNTDRSALAQPPAGIGHMRGPSMDPRRTDAEKCGRQEIAPIAARR
jgi:hypothetical protein